ncbi:transmembrane protein 231-like [Centruroides sculpturatus]|uniref:transmembrane protein 231-like n=1 Tax=Centruroides sculpturatus TaxID=218467 RepID=UPI000C6CD7B2|nr:transmembrane protein 231-like [Centruroides sculpturatus]
MVVYEVFSHSVHTKYKTTICSKATIYYVVSTFFMITLPFIIAYRTEGFWKKIEFYREQPQVKFKHELLLIVETSEDNLLFWSSYPRLNEITYQNIRIPLITNREDDVNRDGKNDILNIKLDVPVTSKENVHSIKLMLFFEYKLHLYSEFIMEGLAYIHHSSPLPGASLSVVGDLALSQKEPLNHKGHDVRFNTPVVNPLSTNIDDYRLESILSSYASRSVTTYLKHSYPVWTTGRGDNSPFTVNITIFYPEQTILYKTGFWQLLKWGWAQYIPIFLVFLYIFHHINIFIFRTQLVPTVTENSVLNNKHQ